MEMSIVRGEQSEGNGYRRPLDSSTIDHPALVHGTLPTLPSR